MWGLGSGGWGLVECLVKGLGFGVQGLTWVAEGDTSRENSGDGSIAFSPSCFRVQGSGFRVQDSGLRAQRSVFSVQCSSIIDHR